MTPYFEKTLCSIVQEIRYTFFYFKKLFNVDVSRVCLILLLLLLLNIVVFPIS